MTKLTASLWQDWWPLIGGISVGFLTLAGIVGFAFLINWLIPAQDKARTLCDAQVETLLYSKDLVEVTRSGIIVDRLNCSLRRRLP